MGINRLFISALLVVAMGVFAIACDSGSTCGEGTHEENGACVVDGDDDGAQGNTGTTGAGNDEDAGTGTQPAPCDGILEGDYTIENTADIDALAGYCEITGDLTVSETAITSLSLPALTSVGGKLEVWYNEVLTSFELPALTSVAGDLLVVSLHALTSFSLSALKTVGGDLMVASNGALPSFSLPALYSVGGTLEVGALSGGNPDLTSFDLPALTSVGGTLEVSSNAALTSFDLSALTSVSGSLWVGALSGGNPDLTSFDLPALTSVGGTLEVSSNAALTSFDLSALTSVDGELFVWHNDALTSFSLPALTSVGPGDWGLLVYDNPALTSFELPSLTSLENHLWVYDNYALAQCLVDAFVDQIEAGEGIGGDISFCGFNCGGSTNNTNCDCSEVDGVLDSDCGDHPCVVNPFEECP